MKILLKDSSGEIKEIVINQNMEFDISKGEQFYVTGASNYDMYVVNNETDIVLLLTNNSLSLAPPSICPTQLYQ